MIRSFADKETEGIWNERASRRLPVEIQQRALNKLAMIHRAVSLGDLRIPPANRLEALRGDRRGQVSDAHKVTITDYH